MIYLFMYLFQELYKYKSQHDLSSVLFITVNRTKVDYRPRQFGGCDTHLAPFNSGSALLFVLFQCSLTLDQW